MWFNPSPEPAHDAPSGAAVYQTYKAYGKLTAASAKLGYLGRANNVSKLDHTDSIKNFFLWLL